MTPVHRQRNYGRATPTRAAASRRRAFYNRCRAPRPAIGPESFRVFAIKAWKSEPAVRSSTTVRESLDSYGHGTQSTVLARISRTNRSRPLWFRDAAACTSCAPSDEIEGVVLLES